MAEATCADLVRVKAAPIVCYCEHNGIRIVAKRHIQIASGGVLDRVVDRFLRDTQQVMFDDRR